MEALQKLKTLALQCTAASPFLSFRRRKTLRRILRSPFSSRRRRRHADLSRLKQAAKEKKPLIAGNSLKDLFVKSPPPSPEVLGGGGVGDSGRWKRIAMDGLGGSGHRGVVIGRRVGLAGLRYRLLRPAWRPKLVAIPELRTEDAEFIL
ncbi:uncharacterized protein LOC110105043 [Dendrobium catenatum]|uniref:Uncharacterized protein n=1 Tax=Dendrobium catenatum TaxID=906689 RepID=A0A2I0VJ71_9ASPA|nr:uncharacterized protein LOC110105043 [Dendrobium catenatum]PKU63451.1 hypothetical protein MA16_Dca025680 [Dendrobium catenatum]